MASMFGKRGRVIKGFTPVPEKPVPPPEASFIVHGTVTGRVSARAPSRAQIPAAPVPRTERLILAGDDTWENEAIIRGALQSYRETATAIIDISDNARFGRMAVFWAHQHHRMPVDNVVSEALITHYEDRHAELVRNGVTHAMLFANDLDVNFRLIDLVVNIFSENRRAQVACYHTLPLPFLAPAMCTSLDIFVRGVLPAFAQYNDRPFRRAGPLADHAYDDMFGGMDGVA